MKNRLYIDRDFQDTIPSCQARAPYPTRKGFLQFKGFLYIRNMVSIFLASPNRGTPKHFKKSLNQNISKKVSTKTFQKKSQPKHFKKSLNQNISKKIIF
jgi:hypothetical protein